MKYWLPLWLATVLFGIYGIGTTSTTESPSLTAVTQDSGAKLIGGLTPGDPDPDGPGFPENDSP